MKIALILLILCSVSIAKGQSLEPYYDIWASLNPEKSVLVSNLTKFERGPNTSKLIAPVEAVGNSEGLHMGFMSAVSVRESPVFIDVTFTEFSFNIFRKEGDELQPVIDDDGTPLINVPVTNFGSPSGITPSVHLHGNWWSDATGAILTQQEEILGTTFEDVYSISVEDHFLPWGFYQNFTEPKEGETYVITWNICFIPVHNGITYPEVNLDEAVSEKHNNLRFEYQAKVLPEPLSEITDMSDDAVSINFQSQHIQYYSLQRSDDLLTWEDVEFNSEEILEQAYLGNNKYGWTLRRRGQSFFRLKWVPEPQFWYHYSYNDFFTRDENVEWEEIAESTEYIDSDGNELNDIVIGTLEGRISAISDNDIYIPRSALSHIWAVYGYKNTQDWNKEPNVHYHAVVAFDNDTPQENGHYVIRSGKTFRYKVHVVVQSGEGFDKNQRLYAFIAFNYKTSTDGLERNLIEGLGLNLGYLDE